MHGEVGDLRNEDAIVSIRPSGSCEETPAQAGASDGVVNDQVFVAHVDDVAANRVVDEVADAEDESVCLENTVRGRDLGPQNHQVYSRHEERAKAMHYGNSSVLRVVTNQFVSLGCSNYGKPQSKPEELVDDDVR